MSTTHFALYATLLTSSALASTTTFKIPSTAPPTAAVLDPAPISISYEFFAFPSYFLNVSNTQQCVQNLQNLSGVPPPIRIGGTTQDRAVYDPSLAAYVDYSVPNYTVAPSNLTFGPSFMTLAGTWTGGVVVGLNRGHDNLSNTIAAAKVAVERVPSLYALELGNEPDLYLSNGQQIATDTGTWTPAQDAASEATWQTAVSSALNKTHIIQAGNFVSGPPTWSAAELVANENASALPYIRDWSHHNYNQGGSSANLTTLMNHTDIVDNVATYLPDLAVAAQTGKEYVIGETNSVSGGGAATVSPTLGGALWVMDFALRAATVGIRRIYFHFGTVGDCAYCWWGRGTVASPYYGGYFAAAALADGAYIGALDNGTSFMAGYAIYDAAKTPMGVVLYNSVYYDGNGTRPVETFVLEGLQRRSSVQAKRLTAPNGAVSRQDEGSNPTFAGQTFANGTCVKQGEEVVETVPVRHGTARFELAASEALLLDLC